MNDPRNPPIARIRRHRHLGTVEGADHVVILMRTHLQKLMSEVLATNELTLDDDGDIRYQSRQAYGYASVMRSRKEVSVEFALLVASDIKPTRKLLEEINSINCSSPWIQVILTNGQVIVRRPLDWLEVNEESVRRTVFQTNAVADDIAELIAVVHGGITPRQQIEAATGDKGEN